jgi:uncharacterized membrane protein
LAISPLTGTGDNAFGTKALNWVQTRVNVRLHQSFKEAVSWLTWWALSLSVISALWFNLSQQFAKA